LLIKHIAYFRIAIYQQRSPFSIIKKQTAITCYKEQNRDRTFQKQITEPRSPVSITGNKTAIALYKEQNHDRLLKNNKSVIALHKEKKCDRPSQRTKPGSPFINHKLQDSDRTFPPQTTKQRSPVYFLPRILS
jgi:hypothetical protein